MVSALSPQNFGKSDQVDLVGSYLGGQRMAQGNQIQQQNIQQNQQEISKADYEQATQRLSVINRLATKVKELPASDRPAFVQSINQDMLRSVGIDPAQISTVQLDDNSLDALIAQTSAALPQGNFRKESVNTSSGLQVFDPSTGTYKTATGADGKPLQGAQYDAELQRKIAEQKQTGQNTADLALKPQIAAATDTAKANVELATKPNIEATTTAATEKAKIDAINKQSENVAAGKLDDANALYTDLSKADLEKVYGRGESKYPDWARSQEGLDMIAKRNQLVAMLKLGARGELKGQGAVSDSESAMVADAATLLNNPDISPTLAKEALDRAMNVLRRNAGKTQGGSGKGSSTPGINSNTGSNKTLNVGKYQVEVH